MASQVSATSTSRKRKKESKKKSTEKAPKVYMPKEGSGGSYLSHVLSCLVQCRICHSLVFPSILPISSIYGFLDKGTTSDDGNASFHLLVSS